MLTGKICEEDTKETRRAEESEEIHNITVR
jgi:hypothetical protein